LLLDRRKIRRWAKWIALALAIIFALGFLFLGIGFGGAGFNLSELFNGGCDSGSTTASTETNAELQKWLDAVAADPADTASMLKIAAYYGSLYKASDGTSAESADSAIEYYKKALAVDPNLKETYLTLAKLYIDMGSYSDAAAILNQATAVDPQNPDVYFYLGRAQKSAGNTGAAILAWQKYLELAPDTKLADSVRTELEKMMAPSTTTTVAPTTTTASTTTTTK
jgi:tetratricopeptide (TPR) repeat protein